MITAAAPVFAGPPPFVPFLFLVPVFWVLVAGLIVFLVVRSRRGWWAQQGPAVSAERTLAERFAQGGIEEQEYRARLEVLRVNQRR